MTLEQRSSTSVWIGTLALFVGALGALVATLDDLGLTWDEPVYRYSQQRQADWFARVFAARSWDDLQSIFSRERLHEDWESARYGRNFHPPLAGMLANLTHLATGRWLGEIESRRLASALELAGAAALLFHFLARRYGMWVGGVAGCSLVLMPRVFGHGHIGGTDMPMLFFWAAAALAFVKAQSSRWWQAVFAVLLAMGFLVKLPTVLVVVPLVGWVVLSRLARSERGTVPSHVACRTSATRKRADQKDGTGVQQTEPGSLVVRAAVGAVLLVPLVVAAWEMHRLAGGMRSFTQSRLPVEQRERYLAYVNLLEPGVSTALPGWILLLPAALWLVRRGALSWAERTPGRIELRPGGKETRASEPQPPRSAAAVARYLGRGGPLFETVLACVALCPAVVLMLNPAWWRDTLIRMGHYYALCVERRAALPDIEIAYLGHKYVYSLPWHNGWLLVGVTVPLSILLFALVGCAVAVWRVRRDSLPLFFLLNFLALPVFRMLPTPAHDGVRLMLPAFFFLAGLAGLGFGWLAGGARSPAGRAETAAVTPTPPRRSMPAYVRPVLAAAVLVPAAVALVRSHPFELSYYNRAVGGLRGAVERGLEISYWYDAVTLPVLDDLNRELPEGAKLALPGQTDVFAELQDLGRLRADLDLTGESSGPTYALLLTHSAKSRPTTRLLFALEPAFPPVTYQGVRLFSVYDARALARAQSLTFLTRAVAERPSGERARMQPPTLSEEVFKLARSRPQAVLGGAKLLADGSALAGSWPEDPHVRRFLAELLPPDRQWGRAREIISTINGGDANALVDAARILIERPEVVAHLVRSECYVAMEDKKGFLDEQLGGDGDAR